MRCLSSDDTAGGVATTKRPRLSLLKRLTQSTAAKAVRARVANLVEISTIHESFHDILPAIVHDGRSDDAAKLAQLHSLLPTEDTAVEARSQVDELRRALAGGTSSADYNKVLVVDGLIRNDVVRSDIHATDSHGYAEAIFTVTHLLGISYAPRIKNIGDQTLYGFRSRSDSDHASWAIPTSSITPTRRVKRSPRAATD